MESILGFGAIGQSLANTLDQVSIEYQVITRKQADLRNRGAALQALQGSKVGYITLGLPYDGRTWLTNWPLIMTNLIDAAEETGTDLVFFDNVYMYGPVDGIMNEQTPWNPVTPMGKARAQTARLFIEAIEKGRINGLIARSADFYGHETSNAFTNRLVFERILDDKLPQWLCDLDQQHSLTYLPDIGYALEALAHAADSWNQTWHLPTASKPLTGREFIEEACVALGRPAGKMQTIRPWMLSLIGWFAPVMKEVRATCYQFDRPYLFDSSKFERRFFEATDYHDGIREIASQCL